MILRWAWNHFRLVSTSDPAGGNAVLVCDECHRVQDTGTFFPGLADLIGNAQLHMQEVHVEEEKP